MKHDDHTFKHGDTTVQIHDMGDGMLAIHVWGKDGEKASSYLPHRDGTGVSLAVMEAAIGNNEAVSMEFAEGLSGLRREVRRVEERDKATREQAELEAEALELYKALRISQPLESLSNWGQLGDVPAVKERWLAVARRAREMSAEK